MLKIAICDDEPIITSQIENHILTLGRTENFNGKLSDVEEILSDGKISFLRIHQSYLA